MGVPERPDRVGVPEGAGQPHRQSLVSAGTRGGWRCPPWGLLLPPDALIKDSLGLLLEAREGRSPRKVPAQVAAPLAMLRVEISAWDSTCGRVYHS